MQHQSDSEQTQTINQQQHKSEENRNTNTVTGIISAVQCSAGHMTSSKHSKIITWNRNPVSNSFCFMEKIHSRVSKGTSGLIEVICKIANQHLEGRDGGEGHEVRGV